MRLDSHLMPVSSIGAEGGGARIPSRPHISSNMGPGKGSHIASDTSPGGACIPRNMGPRGPQKGGGLDRYYTGTQT